MWNSSIEYPEYWFRFPLKNTEKSVSEKFYYVSTVYNSFQNWKEIQKEKRDIRNFFQFAFELVIMASPCLTQRNFFVELLKLMFVAPECL